MWKDLNMKEKAAFMKVAINNGITDLGSIRDRYNSYAEGGDLNINDVYNALNGNLISTQEHPISEDQYLKLRTELNNINKNYYRNKEKEYYNNRENINLKYSIPFLKEKEITLSNADDLTGATLSTNMLDSIYKYAEAAELPLIDAIGLAAQETTFGNRVRINGKSYQDDLKKDINPVELVSDWEYRRSPLEYLNNKAATYAANKNKDKRNKAFNYLMGSLSNPYFNLEVSNKLSNQADLEEAIYSNKFIKEHKKEFEKAANTYNEEPPLLHAFKYFKSGKYNPLDLKHSEMVKDKGTKAINSPQIQKWLKNKNN